MSRTTTMNRTTTYEVIPCVDCGVDIAAPDGFLDRRRKDSQRFYCLNGHSQSWTESEADKLRKKLKEAEAQRIAAEDQLAAEKAERARQAKRATAGVCPCCNRSFVQLARHMKTKHPEHAAT